MTTRQTKLLAPLALLLPLGLLAQNPVYVTPFKELQAKVAIMAISTNVHQAFAGNQDTYLADVALKDGHQTVRLVDLYSGSGDPIRRSLLTDRKQFVMRLIRKPECDIPAASFHLDRSGYNTFDTASAAALAQTPDATLPCYAIVHDKTRLAKN